VETVIKTTEAKGMYFFTSYLALGVIGTVHIGHVTMCCSIALVFGKFTVARTGVNGAPCMY
jgi:hypothetical protein